MYQVLVDRINPNGSQIGFVAAESFVPEIALRSAQTIRDKGKELGLNQIVTLQDKEGKTISF